MNLAEIVVYACHFQPVSIGINHSIPVHVVNCCTPKDGLLATGVFRDVSADRTGIVGVRINRENPAFGRGLLCNFLIHGAGAGLNRRHFFIEAFEFAHFYIRNAVQFFGINNSRARMQRHCTTGIPGAASAGNNHKIKIDQRFNDPRHFIFRVRINDYERIFDTPVSRIRYMTGSRKTVETNIVCASVFLQLLHNQSAKIPGTLKGALEFFNHHQCSLHQSCDFSR